MSTIPAQSWGQAVRAIETAGQISLACHISPDGDALGSMLAFAHGLRHLDRRFTVSFGEPYGVPAMLAFLPGLEMLSEPSLYPAAPDVMITFDAARRDRLGGLAPAAERARELIVLDHHVSNPGFGTIDLVDHDAAATAVVTDQLLTRLGVPLTKDSATCLYAGLASDTGSFKYAMTTPAVHALAGRLIEAGAKPDEVSRELWDRSSFGLLKVLGIALERAVLDEAAIGGLGLVSTTVSRADRLGVGYDRLEGIIDVLRRADEAEVAVVAKENDEGRWYVSTRSKGAVDVGRACEALGGGGHRLAAAFTADGDVQALINRLKELL
ncbi:bifunctional oligoribonuclease/PAP phosphatase NrnA [Actinocorallia longicatena]|uniref:Bifunctional oligoribonuclease/PAP phosphatase NrnA n=1 Tax=Actinocorallia longicatena TaxID=111803 RepID=A0ABP6QS23_9ACTN